MTRRSEGMSLVGLVISLGGCANGYSATYQGSGEAASALAFARDAEANFDKLSAAEAAPAVAKVRVFLGSIPGELSVDGTTIGVKQGAGELVGSVRIIATVIQPSEQEIVPVLQKAAFAAGADLAYCPTEGMAWRCYLVRTAAGPGAATP